MSSAFVAILHFTSVLSLIKLTSRCVSMLREISIVPYYQFVDLSTSSSYHLLHASDYFWSLNNPSRFRFLNDLSFGGCSFHYGFVFPIKRQCTIGNVRIFRHFDFELSLELGDQFFQSTLLDMSSIYTSILYIYIYIYIYLCD